MAELDQPRFAKATSDPNYALDPTDPQFKRSATYVRQLAHKQKEVPRSQEEVKATMTTLEVKPESKKTERHETTNAIKSVKMKMKNQQKDSEEMKKKTETRNSWFCLSD